MANFPYKDRQDELNSLLVTLSQNVCEDVNAYVETFSDIYAERNGYVPFRHSYGTITGRLLQESKNNPDYFDFLDQNLNSVIDALIRKAKLPGTSTLKAKELVQIMLRVQKLRDHISLERTRIQEIYHTYEEKADDAERRYTEASNLLVVAKSQAEDASRIKTEVVSILSIFAAVIIAFTGGISLLGSAFQSVSNVSIYKVLVSIILCAFAMFNTISILMFFVSKIVGKSILSQCNTPDCTCDEPCKLHIRIKRRLPLLYWINIFFVALVSLCVLAWLIDFHSFAIWFRNLLPWTK